jgi:hypothetical protein
VKPVSHISCSQVSQPHFGQVWGEAQHFQSWGFGVLRDSRMFRVRQQGPKHLALGCSWCHWKGLKSRYRKWPRIGHLDICSPSYGQKKGRESNWQFDSRPLKVGNRHLPDLRIESETWRWKDLDEGYNFGLDLLRSDLAVGSYELPKSRDSNRDSFGTISGLQLGSPGKKSHLDVVPAE